MPTASNAKLQYEAGEVTYAMAALSDSGDHTNFTSSNSYWSRASGFTPTVLPNGLVNGGAVIPAVSGTNDYVDVAAILCNLNGVVTSVSASTDETITRPATAVAKVNSVTVNSSGAIAVVAGTDGGSTTFSETRGAAGGPPYIPTTSIEVAQVRVTSDTSAAITAAQIFAVPGTHREESNYPTYEIDYENGKVTLAAAVGLHHTGDLAKAVYASYATATFADLGKVKDFVPAEESASVSSTQYYGGTLASTSTSLAQATFTSYLDDGINDALITKKGENLWFKFFPDRLKSPYHLLQGRLDVTRSFPVVDQIQVAATISCEAVGSDHAS